MTVLTSDQIEVLGDQAQQLIQPVIDFLIEDIARRISQAGQLTATAAYQTWRLQQLGVSQQQLKKELRKRLKVTHRELRKLLEQSAEVGYDFDIRHLPYVQAVPFSRNTAVQQIVSAAVQLAQDDLTNITQTIGFVGTDGTARELTAAYQQACDFAFMKVSTGAQDYNAAVRMATRNLTEQGIVTIDYASGVHTSLEAAVRRNVIGGLGLMQEQISRQNHDDFGCDGWEISAHAASAPDHEPIQGKQYSDADYEALNNSLVRRIGTLNCGHSAFPIILGVDSPQYTPEELAKMRQANEKGVDYNGRRYTMYEATQHQRKLERAIRKQKRRILAAEQNPDDKDRLQQAQIKYQLLDQEYKRFSRSAGLRVQHERMEMAGFGPKQAKAAEKIFDKYSGLHYNKDGTIVVTDDWTAKGHVNMPKKYMPNAVVDTLSQGGKQRDRTIYGADAVIKQQIHGGAHGQPKKHPYGKHGEHIHDYTWYPDMEKPDRPARNASDAERIVHSDILGGESDDSR